MTKSRKILGFIGLVLAMFMGALDATIVNIALPNIMEDLHTGLTDTSWVATIYVLAMSVFIITVSKLADIYGRKLVMLIGVVIFGIFSFACMLADSLLLLIIFRFFQGIGGAILTPIVLPMGIELLGKENTSRITAIMGAFSALAAAGGPVIGSLIVHWTTYHWIFGINVPIAIIAFLMILVGTKESYDLTISKNIDWLGIIFLTCTLGGLIFGLLEGHEYGWGSQTIIASFFISVVGLFFLFLTERRVESPVIDLKLFKESTFTSSSLIYMILYHCRVFLFYMIFGFAIIVPSLILNYFLQNVRNYSALHSAYLIIPTSLAIVVGMPLATKMYQKISARLLISIGLVITAGGLFMLSLIQYNTSQSIIVCCNVIIGLGLGFMAMSLTSSVKYLPINKAGIGSGIVNSSRYVGQAISMALLVTILNSNVNIAKTQIKETAYNQIEKRVLSTDVKKVAKKEIAKTFDTTKNSNSISTKQSNMVDTIKTAAQKTDNLPEPKKGSNYRKIYDTNQLLINGVETISSSVSQLSSSLKTISGGQAKVGTAVKLLAQRDELSSALKVIVNEKNDQLSRAFDNVFIVGAIVVLICTPSALMTEKRKVE